MSWSYSGDPSASPKDAVRFLVGDTQEGVPLAQNEEIEWVLTQYKNIYAAAAQVAISISAFFATQADMVKIGPISEQSNGRALAYANLAMELKREAASKRTLNITGAIEGLPMFAKGMNDNNGSSVTSSVFVETLHSDGGEK